MLTHALRLAWAQLSRKKARLFTAIAGIAFADVLMFMQLGFQEALYASAVTLPSHLVADVVLIHPKYQYTMGTLSFPRRRLWEALVVPEVESASSVMFGIADWRNPATRRMDQIFAMGISLAHPVFDIPAIESRRGDLARPDLVLFDALSRPKYGPLPDLYAASNGRPVPTEANHCRVEVGGVFDLGTTFVAHGNIIMGEQGFLRIFPNRHQGVVDVGLLRLREGADPATARDKLRALLPPDVDVLLKSEFVQRERDFWDENSPISYIFTLGVVVGFIVGLVIVYQILHSDVSDHLAEYATLKAMGYADSYLFSVVGFEAVILALLGYLPALLVSFGIYELTEKATLLPMNLGPLRIVGMLVAGVVMCVLSGALALKKIRTADPAEVF